MVHATTQRSPFKSSLLVAVTILLTAAIFSVDAFTTWGMAIAALYSVVILLSSRFLDRGGVLLVSLGCVGLTIAAYLLSHGLDVSGMPMLRFLVSLAAIGTTAFLALEDKAASATQREHAGLLDLTRDGIFVRDMNEVITYWNRGAEEAYGWKSADVVGKAVAHDLLHTVFPLPFDRIKAELLQTGRWDGELVHTKADGSQMVVSSRWALLYDDKQRPVATLETNNDVTEQKSAIEALREGEAQWREVFEHNPVSYFMVDAAGSVLSVNSFGAGQLGYSVAELLGRSVLEVFREEDRELIRQNLAACVAAPGRSRSWEVGKVRKDGSTLWVRENAKAVRRPGNEPIVLVACEDITERRRNEDRLRRSEAYLAEAQRLSQMGSFGWELATGKITWSEETFRIFGCDPAVSPTLDMVLERTHPEDRAAVRRTIDKVRRDGLDYEHEYRLLMPDGAVKHVHVVASTSKDSSGEVEMVGAVMDVTAAKEAESRIGQIIDAVPATIWRARSDGSMDFLNARALQYVGMTMQEVLDSGWGGQIHPDDFPHAYGNWLVGLAERKPIESVLRLRRFDGEYRWFLSRALPLLDHAGNILAWYGSDADIHDSKLAEEALLKARADLAHVTRVTTMGELSASIVHEVNQPLAAIVTNGEVGLRLLGSDVPDMAEMGEVLQAMISDGKRASDIIRRLRTLSLKTETQTVELDLNEIVAEVVPLVREEVLGKHVSLRLDLAPALPVILGDRVQLQQVVINLLLNAVEAMASVDGRPRELAIRSQRHGSGQVLITVQDSGIGIDPQNAKGLFEPFYTTKPNGMGMGLSICRSIVESHGGTIWASANDGPGATFQFALPLPPEQADA